MNEFDICDEIDYVYSFRRKHKELVRPAIIIYETILQVSNGMMPLIDFYNDYAHLLETEKITRDFYNAAINDLYLMALQLKGRNND